MKNIIFLFFASFCTHFCIGQTDTIADKQLIGIFADLPLSKTKESWKTILENQKEKYIDTLPGIPGMSSFIISDISFYQTISANVNKGYIRISDYLKSNSEGTDTISSITIFLHLTPGTTKKEAKEIYTKFKKIVARNYSYEHYFPHRAGVINSFTYSNYKIDWLPPIRFSLVEIKEKNIYSITFIYQNVTR